MEYKESLYNFLFPFTDGKEGDMVVYNGRTTSLSIMDKEHYKIFTDLINDGVPIADKEFEQQLVKCGCIVQKNVDEVKMLRLRLNQIRYNANHLTLTIAPTMNCNFRCVYCYETKNLAQTSSMMSEDVQRAIVELARKKARSIEALHIVWYGGEPLLALDIIESLSTQLIQVAEENNIIYDAIMVTNGYFLTKDVAKKLAKLKVSSLQVTIDGPKHVHDKRRVLAGGEGTFEKIITNLQESSKEIEYVSLRINTDHDNEHEVDSVVELLKERGIDNVYCYLGYVQDLNEYGSDRCMNMATYGKKQFEFSCKHGFSPMIDYPLARANFCSADFYYAYLIDPEGYLYNCWNDIGDKEKRTGSIFDDEKANYNLEYFMEYMLFDPTDTEQCHDCKFLPICMGGCPYRRIHNGENCTDKKFIMEDYLTACVKYMIKQRTAQ